MRSRRENHVKKIYKQPLGSLSFSLLGVITQMPGKRVNAKSVSGVRIPLTPQEGLKIRELLKAAHRRTHSSLIFARDLDRMDFKVRSVFLSAYLGHYGLSQSLFFVGAGAFAVFLWRRIGYRCGKVRNFIFIFSIFCRCCCCGLARVRASSTSSYKYYL